MTGAVGETPDTSIVLKVEEVAEFLRTEPTNVRELLNTGELAGFKIGGEWRIVSEALLDYLRRAMKAEADAALERGINDPRLWAEVIRDDPEFVAMLNAQEYEEGSAGAWFKDALEMDARERDAGNVVPLKPRPQ